MTSSDWEGAIRTLEDKARLAFLAADVAALDTLWAPGYIVNSPLNRVLPKAAVLEALRTRRIRHLRYDAEIEQLARQGDVVVVMGRDTVQDQPDGPLIQRRFTNVWGLVDGSWRGLARHAHVLPPPAA